MAAARQYDDEMRDKRSNTTTEEDNSMTTGRWHQRTIEMSAEERWRFPTELGREVPRDKVMTRVQQNTEAGTQTNATREEEDLKRAAEEQWNNPWRKHAGEKQHTTEDNRRTGACESKR